ncbi:MAG: pyridoxamine 5'-phosphate oxidase family protein [Deltaproteobacteria bacterium]|nr:pyridoxamine 5'-phosphate oxidase family protein [Deltaproteobacteria bacterium]
MPKLTAAEIHEFLQERGHLARIATIKPDGSPSVVPVWFICEDGKILITPRKYSAFCTNVQHAPRVAITIDEDTGRYRKVLVEGTARTLFTPGQDDQWRDIYRRIACRYVDDQSADYYLSETIDQPRALIGVDLVRAKVTTWRMPGEGEAYTGIWHKRYYEAGSKMARMAAGSSVGASGEKLKIG